MAPAGSPRGSLLHAIDRDTGRVGPSSAAPEIRGAVAANRSAGRDVGNVPPPLGAGRGSSGAAPPPGQWPVRATPTRNRPGPQGRGPTRRGRLSCSLTIRSFVTLSKCGSGTIISTNVDPSEGNRYRRRSPRRETPRPPAQDPTPASDRAIRPSPAGRATPGRRGQVPKGTGGMPRRHQKCGRGRLRYVRGSGPTRVDPGMPAQTRGTETSQYPEEKKATATPSVAASERGTA